MPMNARLLRPLARSGDSTVRAYIAAVEAADQQALEQGVKDAIKDFIIGCKADGIWSTIKGSCILMGARTLSGALTPLAGAAPTNNNFVSGDYHRRTGLVGDAATKSLFLGLLASDLNATSHHFFIRGESLNEATGNRVWMGVYHNQVGGVLATLVDFVARDGNGVRSFRSGSATSGQFAFVNISGRPAQGSYAGTRASSGALRLYQNGIAVSGVVASGVPTMGASPIGVFARNDNNGTPTVHTASRLCFFSAGDGLSVEGTNALHNRTDSLQTAIQAAIP